VKISVRVVRDRQAFVHQDCSDCVELHLRDGRTDGRTVCPYVRPSLRWSLTHSLHDRAAALKLHWPKRFLPIHSWDFSYYY